MKLRKRGFLIMMVAARASAMEAPRLKLERAHARRLWLRWCCRWRGHRCCCRVLAIEIVNESTRNVDVFGGISERHVTTVDDHSDTARFGERFQCRADISLQRKKDVLPAFLVGSLGVLTLALVLDIRLIELLALLPDRVWVGNGLRVVNLFGQGVDSGLQVLQFALPWLKLAIQGVHQGGELDDACFGIQKLLRIDYGHFAIRYGYRGRSLWLRCRSLTGWRSLLCLC